MYRTPTRKAILIASPGESNYLLGPEKDLKNVSEYLQSEKAGVWFDHEIKTLFDPSVQEVRKAIANCNADYVFVYFSGHGYTDEDTGARMVCLKDGNLRDLELLNKSKKQLILVDACRNFFGQGISGLADFEDEYSYFTGSPLRGWFDNHILNSPDGKIIVHGTQIGHFSYDSIDGTGGMFTNALLYIGTRMDSDVENKYAPALIEAVVSYVPEVLKKWNNSQIPSIVYKTGNLTVPFAIGMPKRKKLETKKVVPQRKLATVSNGSSGAGWAFLGLSLIVLAIASAD